MFRRCSHIYALLGLVLVVGCTSRPEETIQLVRVSSSLLTSPSPPGHQLRSVAVDGDGRVWLGSLDAGLSLLMPGRNRFQVLTPDIAEFGTEVDAIQRDPRTGDLLIKLGTGPGRLVRYDPRRRIASLVKRPQQNPTSTNSSQLDLRDPERGWVKDFAVLEDGSIWATTLDRPAGLHIDVTAPNTRFIKDSEDNPVPLRLIQGDGQVWGISAQQALNYDVGLLSTTDAVELARPVHEILDRTERGPQVPAFEWMVGAAASGDNLWIAADKVLWSRAGNTVERSSVVESYKKASYIDVMRSGERLWVQVDDMFSSLDISDPSQARATEFVGNQSTSRMLGGSEGSMWVGSQLGMFGLDTGPGNDRPYPQSWMLPTSESVVLRTRDTLFDQTLLPQQVLSSRIGLLLAGWGMPPAKYDEETGLWEPLPLDSRVRSDGVVTTVVTSRGYPVLLTKTGIRRWDERGQRFGAHIGLREFLRDGERLDIAVDQYNGIIALACPEDNLWSEVSECRVAAYLSWSGQRPMAIKAMDDCFKPLSNGLRGWVTSERHAMLACPPETVYLDVSPELSGGLRVAIKQLLNPTKPDFEPLTTMSSRLRVGWVVRRGELGIWKYGGVVESVPVTDRTLLASAYLKRDHRRFAMDVAGNLCHIHPTIGQSRARIWCINTLGSLVFSWYDEEGKLGSLHDARLRVAPDGHLWIDGLKGRVAWLAQGSDQLHVIELDKDDRPRAYERPLSRILGFDRDHRAWVAGRAVVRIAPRLNSSGLSKAEVVSSRRLWDRDHWPLVPLKTNDGSNQFVLASPEELIVASLSSRRQRKPLPFRRMFGDERSPVGPNVSFMDAGREPGELWVGLRDGGALHYQSGQPRQRYSRKAGLGNSEILALAALPWGALASTPSGLYWLDPDVNRARRIRVSGLLDQSVTALAYMDQAKGTQGAVVFAATDSGEVWRLELPIEVPDELEPGADGTQDGGQAQYVPPTNPVQTKPMYVPIAPTLAVKLATLEGRSVKQLLAIGSATSTSGRDDLLIGTTSGLLTIPSARDLNGEVEPDNIRLGKDATLEAETTALTALPDGRVAAAVWDGYTSSVSLHNPTTGDWWAVVHPDNQVPVHALAPMELDSGEVYLVARQSETLMLTSVPLVSPTQIPGWVWMVLMIFGVGLAALALAIRGGNPLVARLQADPEALREMDLDMLPGVDRTMGRYRETLLAAAGITEARWDLATRLGGLWSEEKPAWPPVEGKDGLISILCEALSVTLLETKNLDASKRPFPIVCRVKLPRLPINLPTQETALIILPSRDLVRGLTQSDPRYIEDMLGQLLRELGQSMGTPFLLVTDLDEEPLPMLIHARFPGVIFRGERLRELLYAEVPRQKLSQAILMDAWLDAISPYKSSGPVDDPAMFMGRERVRRELISARSVSAIVCGGRRVGKTSLIRQLVRDLARERPDVKVYEISLLGIRSYSAFVERLERRLDISISHGEAPEQKTTEQTRSSIRDRLKARRGRRSKHSMTPDLAAAMVREALESHAGEKGEAPLLILDEIDGIAARDAEAGYPLLSTLHQLKGESICSFLLVGFAELYRQTYDYDSPLYNFARVLQLRGLDEAAALRLVSEPMHRLGVTVEDPWIAQEIVDKTAGLPNLVQFICDMLLRSLSEHGRTTIQKRDLEAILDFSNPASQPLSAYLAESFDQNVGHEEEILVYTMLLNGPRPSSLSDIDANLTRQGIDTNLARRRAMVRRLKLVGVLKELPGEQYDVALPLLVQLLLSKDLRAAVDALVDELQERRLSSQNEEEEV